MNRRLKLIQPELTFADPPKPREIVATGEDYLALCRRAESGELAIEAVAVGRTPAEWVCRVRWPNDPPTEKS